MKKTKWEIARDSFAVLLLAVSIYVGGFVIIRTQFVEHTKSPTVMSFYIQKLERNSDGFLGKTIDFYKPAFVLEAVFHKAESVVINGWRMGMRAWKVPQF